MEDVVQGIESYCERMGGGNDTDATETHIASKGSKHDFCFGNPSGFNYLDGVGGGKPFALLSSALITAAANASACDPYCC